MRLSGLMIALFRSFYVLSFALYPKRVSLMHIYEFDSMKSFSVTQSTALKHFILNLAGDDVPFIHPRGPGVDPGLIQVTGLITPS